MVIIQNALDHCADPMKAIWEALIVLKQGGVLYLNHHPNEAEHEQYRGFHQYNICIEDGHLKIWNRINSIDVTTLLAGVAIMEVKLCDGNPIAIITKTAAVSDLYINRRDDVHLMMEALISYSEYFNNTKYIIKYHCKYLFFRVVQWFSKLLSWKMRQKIKQLIK